MKTERSTRRTRRGADDLRPEYDFDFSKSRPNPYAGRVSRDRVLVLLDTDVSQVFTDAASVNAILRALIASMPGVKRSKKGRSTRRVAA